MAETSVSQYRRLLYTPCPGIPKRSPCQTLRPNSCSWDTGRNLHSGLYPCKRSDGSHVRAAERHYQGKPKEVCLLMHGQRPFLIMAEQVADRSRIAPSAVTEQKIRRSTRRRQPGEKLLRRLTPRPFVETILSDV